MAKRDFSEIDIGNDAVIAGIEQAASDRKPRKKGTPEQIAEAQRTGRTRGIGGAKQKRINMAFSDLNYTYIKVIASATGKNLTEVTNVIIEQHREAHPDALENAQKVLDALKASL